MRTFDTPRPITITVELNVGDVRVVAADRADTVVNVRPTDEAKKAEEMAALLKKPETVAFYQRFSAFKPSEVMLPPRGSAGFNLPPGLELPELGLPAAQEDTITHDFTMDKRVFFVPEARLLLTIPSSNDRLVLYRVGG